jgi:hypothetical protein
MYCLPVAELLPTLNPTFAVFQVLPVDRLIPLGKYSFDQTMNHLTFVIKLKAPLINAAALRVSPETL